jgi:hypothetical protein
MCEQSFDGSMQFVGAWQMQQYALQVIGLLPCLDRTAPRSIVLVDIAKGPQLGGDRRPNKVKPVRMVKRSDRIVMSQRAQIGATGSFSVNKFEKGLVLEVELRAEATDQIVRIRVECIEQCGDVRDDLSVAVDINSGHARRVGDGGSLEDTVNNVSTSCMDGLDAFQINHSVA